MFCNGHSVTQIVEQPPCKWKVVGSSPSLTVAFFPRLLQISLRGGGGVSVLLRQFYQYIPMSMNAVKKPFTFFIMLTNIRKDVQGWIFYYELTIQEGNIKFIMTMIRRVNSKVQSTFTTSSLSSLRSTRPLCPVGYPPWYRAPAALLIALSVGPGHSLISVSSVINWPKHWASWCLQQVTGSKADPTFWEKIESINMNRVGKSSLLSLYCPK